MMRISLTIRIHGQMGTQSQSNDNSQITCLDNSVVSTPRTLFPLSDTFFSNDSCLVAQVAGQQLDSATLATVAKFRDGKNWKDHRC